MKKKVLLTIIGLLLYILPFFYKTYTMFRFVVIFLGIIILLLGCFLGKKINLFKIIFSFTFLIILSYGIDFLCVSFNQPPIFAIINQKEENFTTYESFIYRIYDCNGEKKLDTMYKENYACDYRLLEQDINTFLKSIPNSYQKYHDKFVTIKGKVSEVFGNDYIYLQPYVEKPNGLVGEITFNQNITLKVENNQENLKFYGNYEIYDDVVVTGRVEDHTKDMIILHDAKVENVNNFQDFTVNVKKKKECKNEIKDLTTTDYHYFSDCIESINVEYDQETVYDLLLSLETQKLTFDKWTRNIEKEEDEEKELYKFKQYNLLKCKSSNTVLIGSTKLKLTSKFCDNIPIKE